MSATPSRTVGISLLGFTLSRLSTFFAYFGGIVIAAVGIMSAVSIIGRSVFSRPITGDFELVEIGTALAGTMFLPYCQATWGHISVDLFTLGMSKRANEWLDRFGCLFMAVMFFAVGWRAIVGCIDIRLSGETSMLLGFPIWIGYVGIVPGTLFAGIIALAQSFGIQVSERTANE